MKVTDYIKKLDEELSKQSKELEEIKRMEKIKEIALAYDGDSRVVSAQEIAEHIKSQPPEEKLFSGIDGLDNLLDGFRRKQLVIISALTGVGKTTFAMELSKRMAKHNPLWMSFEQSMDELVSGFMERDEDIPHIFSPLKVTDNTKEWLENKIVEGIAKHNISLVFIDHLHYIIPFTHQRHDLAVGDMVRHLKHLAGKWNVCIFLISHLRKVELDKKPTVTDLKDSSAIGQECDTLLMLSRELLNGVMSNDVMLAVQKNRKKGKLGIIKMCFSDNKFYEHEWGEGVKQNL